MPTLVVKGLQSLSYKNQIFIKKNFLVLRSMLNFNALTISYLTYLIQQKISK